METIKKIMSTILFVVAAALLFYAIWAFVDSYSYVSEMINAGQLLYAGNEYEIFDFFMTSCAHYAVYALLLCAGGLLLIPTKTSVQAVGIAQQEPWDAQTELTTELEAPVQPEELPQEQPEQ